jgi:hypothetical protein
LLQNLLGALLIVPETGRGDPVFERLKLFAFRLWVKETSAIRRRVASNPHTYLANLELPEYQAFSTLLRKL